MKNILSFFLAVSLFAFTLNCNAKKMNNPHYQREWMMVSFDQFSKQELIEKKAGINLTGEKSDNQIKGSAVMGCNRIFFTAQLKNNGKVKISGLGSTEMACQDMNLENAFLKKFGNMTNYTIEGHRLTLFDNNGSEMKFIAADWD